MPPVEQDALIYGPIRVELLTHKVLAQGKFVRLAKMEYRLLCYLILHEGQVLSRQEILTNIWNLPPNVKTRTLDMHIHTLRKKLGLADYLETVLQVGYRLRSIGKKEESPYTTRDGEVIFKKYSLIGGLEDFAAQFCDTLSRNTDFTAAVTDRDGIVAVAGAGKRELLGKNLSPQLEQIMEQRSIYQYRSGQERLPVSESTGQYAAAVAAPILCGGDVLGLVLFVSAEDRLPGEGEYKLAQAVAGFLGKHMET